MRISPTASPAPLTALIDGLRAVMIDGAGLTVVAPRVAVVVGWGVVSFALAMKLFRWR